MGMRTAAGTGRPRRPTSDVTHGVSGQGGGKTREMGENRDREKWNNYRKIFCVACRFYNNYYRKIYTSTPITGTVRMGRDR